MAIVRWNDPFRDLAQLQDRLSRVFVDPYGPVDAGLLGASAWVPPVDVYQNGNHEVVLKAELPDMTREAIEITIENGTLTLKGDKKPSDDIKDDQLHRIERRYGPFSRSFSVPATVDTSRVSAEYKNGVLTVRLPIRDEAKPRQVRVEVAA